MHHDYLLDALVILSAVIVTPLVQRVKISPVIGYLVFGAAIGPYGFRMIEETGGAFELAEIGIVFLLFTLGLELSLERLRAMRREIFELGASQVVICTFLIAAAAWALGVPAETALILGAALSLSSTAVVLQMLSDQGDMVARVGRVTFAILLFQDIAVAPILAMVPLLAEGGDVVALLGLALFRAVLAVAAIVVIGRFLTQPMFKLAARTGRREVFVALALLAALGTAWLTQQAGLSLALGAFLSGLVLAGTIYRHQIEAEIEPFRGILLAFFFMTVGMLIDPAVLINQAGLIIALVIGLIAIKALVIIPLCRVFGLGWPMAVRIGLLLAEGGEFAFVIVGLVLSRGLIESWLGQTLVAVVAMTMALTPILATVGRRLERRLNRRHDVTSDRLAAEAEDLADHVIILGFGRVGQTVATLLADLQIRHLALDLDPGRVATARRLGSLVFYGNATHYEVLKMAGIERAGAVVVTIDQPVRAQQIVAMLREHHPDLPVIVRAHDNTQATNLESAGATRAVPETLEASLQLGRAVLTTVGAPIDDVRQVIQRLRERHYERVDTVVEARGSAPS